MSRVLRQKKKLFPDFPVPLFRPDLALTLVCMCLCESVHTLHLLVTLESLLRHVKNADSRCIAAYTNCNYNKKLFHVNVYKYRGIYAACVFVRTCVCAYLSPSRSVC